MREIASLFRHRAGSHGSTFVQGSGDLPVDVKTMAEQWAYAVWFEPLDQVRRGVVMVRVGVHVRSGTIGIGLLNADRTRFVDEIALAAAPESRQVELVAAAEDLGPLVVRNTSPSGASQATVSTITCYEAAADPDGERQPGLSSPPVVPHWFRYYGTAGDDPLERLRAARFDALERATHVTWADGLSLTIHPRDQLSRAVYVSGTYEPHTLRALRALLGEGDVFLDVGANAGVITVAASRWVGPTGHVYAFEPSDREFQRLLDAVARNQLRQAHPIRAAVGSRAGAATLRVAGPAHGGLNTLADGFAYDSVDVERFETVEVIALDEFVPRHVHGRIAAIKVDVEGAESAVVEGARAVLQRHRPALVVEVFGRALQRAGSTVQALEQQLRAADYDLFRIDDVNARVEPIDSLDALDEQNIVALPRDRADELLTRLGR